MITLTKSGNAIVFTFDDNDHYLNDGTIEVPVNSLTLVTDESQMATFKRSSTNDIFISARYDELGMSKSDLESWFKENACGSTGGGGVTSGDVETMISEATSGLAESSAVTEEISEAVSGKADTSAVTASINAVSGDVNTLSGQVETDEKVTATALVDLDNRKLDASAYTPTDLSNYYTKSQTNTQINNATEGLLNASTFNTYSANTDARISEDEEVTSAALNELNDALDDKADTSAVTASIAAAVSGKQDTLIAGTNITISGNVISAQGSSITVDQTFDRNSENPISNKAISNKATDGDGTVSNTGGKYKWDFASVGGVSTKKGFYLDTINGDTVIKQYNNTRNLNLVETSAITSSVTSASTDSQVPSAKAVYDALQEGGGGLPESAFTAYTAATDARLAEDEEVTAAALNVLSTNMGGFKLQGITQAAYDALVSGGTVQSDTLYIITNVVN